MYIKEEVDHRGVPVYRIYNKSGKLLADRWFYVCAMAYIREHQ